MTRRTSAEIHEPVFDWYDADGFVFRGVTVAEAEPGWNLLDEEQQQHVQPLTKFDAKRFEANEKRKAK